MMRTQPHYSDGTYAWAVDAIRPGGSQRRITSTYVRAATRHGAREAGQHRLRSLIKARGHKGGWRCIVRPAHPVDDLEVTEIKA